MSSRVFESGIKHHWKKMDPLNDIRNNITINRINNEEYLINLQYFFGVFYLLALGLVVAGFVLILEIFWFDCLRHLTKNMLSDYLHDHFTMFKAKRVTHKPNKVTFIQVEPINNL